MNKKLLLYIGMFIITINIAVAQTGLFRAETGNSFLITGIQFIVLIVIGKIVARDFFRRMKSRK